MSHHKHSDKEHEHKPAAESAKPDCVPDEPVCGPETAEPPAADPMAKLAAERDDLMGRLQRLSADYLNYQKRVQREIADARQYANSELIKTLIVVLDDLERTLDAAAKAGQAEDAPMLKGVKLVYDKFLGLLTQQGLERIASEGEPFEPGRHQALMQEESDKVAPGTVVRELQKGYQLKGRILRPAAVSVAKEPEKNVNS